MTKLMAIILVCLPTFVVAQNSTRPENQQIQSRPPSTQSDTTGVEEKLPFFQRFSANWQKPYPNATRAGIYSLVLPGAGQIYNKRYWKAPIVWGGVGIMIGLIQWNKKRFDCYTNALELRVMDPNNLVENDICNSRLIRTVDQLEQGRSNHQRQMQLAIMGTAGVWLLQVLEAYVDAHLRDFDITDDLSLSLDLKSYNQFISLPSASIGLYWSIPSTETQALGQ